MILDNLSETSPPPGTERARLPRLDFLDACEGHAGDPAILIAGRNPEITATVALALQGNQFRACIVEEPDHALQLVEAGHVCAAVLDVELLPGEGLPLLTSLRAAGRLPIIILRDHPSVEEEARWLRAGADDVISKPFPLLRLLARLQAVLRRTRVE